MTGAHSIAEQFRATMAQLYLYATEKSDIHICSNKDETFLIQLNHSNLKPLALEVLFRIISSSNYTEVDMKIYTPQMIIIIFFYET